MTASAHSAGLFADAAKVWFPPFVSSVGRGEWTAQSGRSPTLGHTAVQTVEVAIRASRNIWSRCGTKQPDADAVLEPSQPARLVSCLLCDGIATTQ